MLAGTSNPEFGRVPEVQASTPPSSSIVQFPLQQPNAYPLGITVDARGHVWFAEANTDLLIEFFPNNQSYVSYPIPTEPHLAMIWYLAFDQFGNLWFADPVQPMIWRFSPATHQFANFTTGDPNLKPYALVYEPSSEKMWFTSVYSNQIGAFQISPTGAAQIVTSITLPSGNGQNTGPSGITIDASGDIFVSESFAAKIVEYNPASRSFVYVWSLPSGSQPVGIGVDQQRDLVWFSNHATSLFGFVNMSSGSVTQIATSLFQESVGTQISTTISLPYWLALTSSGQVWFDEHYANRIARFDPGTFELQEFQVQSNNSQPLRFQIDQATGQFWFTEFAGNNLGVINLNATGDSTFVSPSHVYLSTAETSFVVNLPLAQINNESLSGSLSYDGFLSSNLTFAFSSVNSTATKVGIQRGSNLNPGNYTLTVCPDTQSLSKSCSVLFLSVSKTGVQGEYAIYLAVFIVAIAAVVVSILYARRWRK
ncbi:MAG: hypothetical protein JRN52_14335 [Nitrososphaerota archaeon]|nr:hypothetical protein [Nitrososphaerota archaeon]